MSVVKKIQLPDNTVVDINDNRIVTSSPQDEQSLVYDSVNEVFVNDFALAGAIPYGQVDSTSTSTAFTATVKGITELKDGTCMLLKNGVVTSASGFTINVNGLGAKPSYSNLSAATADTTLFNVNYTFLFIYDETRVSGGCWICYRGYNTNDNTIGYQLRTNSSVRPTVSRTRYYRILFSSADNTQWVPANTKYDNSATTVKPVSTTPINPFGRIVYVSGTTNVPPGSNVGATVTWDQYAITLGYSFNTTGSALTLTYPAPVYVKCAPQANGSAIIDSTTPYVQALPSTNDGKIYIYLGHAYSATQIELTVLHPVFYHDGSGIRVWTGKMPFSGSYNDLTDKPNLANVATSGSYNDLTDTPTVPEVLNDLSDVSAASPENGDFILYDEGDEHWENVTPSIVEIEDENLSYRIYERALVDGEGYWYSAAVIGDQVWMVENLRTRYDSAGNDLTFSDDSSDSNAYVTYPGKQSSYMTSHGALYNAAAVLQGETVDKGEVAYSTLLPSEWRIPTESDFETLMATLSRDSQKKLVAYDVTNELYSILFNAQYAGWVMGKDNLEKSGDDKGYVERDNDYKFNEAMYLWSRTGHNLPNNGKVSQGPSLGIMTFNKIMGWKAKGFVDASSTNDEANMNIERMPISNFCSVRGIYDGTVEEFLEYYYASHAAPRSSASQESAEGKFLKNEGDNQLAWSDIEYDDLKNRPFGDICEECSFTSTIDVSLNVGYEGTNPSNGILYSTADSGLPLTQNPIKAIINETVEVELDAQNTYGNFEYLLGIYWDGSSQDENTNESWGLYIERQDNVVTFIELYTLTSEFGTTAPTIEFVFNDCLTKKIDNKYLNLAPVAFTNDYNDLDNTPDVSSALEDLNDVSISTLDDKQVLKYNSSSGNWENSSVELNELADVEIAEPIDYTITEFEDALIDYDGNHYNAIAVGNNVFLTSNYICTHLTDGTAISTGSTQSTTVPYTHDGMYNIAAVLSDNFFPNKWSIVELNNKIDRNNPKAYASTTGWATSSTAGSPGNSPETNNSTGLGLTPNYGSDTQGNYLYLDKYKSAGTLDLTYDGTTIARTQKQIDSDTGFYNVRLRYLGTTKEFIDWYYKQNLRDGDILRYDASLQKWTNSSDYNYIQEVTYDELVQMRDSSQLVRGKQYKIIDYETLICGDLVNLGTVAVNSSINSDDYEFAKAVNMLPFDIIVTATSENSLDEKARACAKLDDDYAQFINTLELKYCLDNNRYYSWALDYYDISITYTDTEPYPEVVKTANIRLYKTTRTRSDDNGTYPMYIGILEGTLQSFYQYKATIEDGDVLTLEMGD